MQARRFIVLVVLIVAWCATGTDSAADVFLDQWTADLEALGIDPAEVVYPFRVNDGMIRWANEQLSDRSIDSPVDRLTLLQDALFGWKGDDFQYDETLTLTAEQAFELHRGNCMSFTALFVGLARGVGVPMSLVAVKKVPDVDREAQLVVVSRHVVAGYKEPGSLVLFDFNLSAEAPVARNEIVGDLTASAMYHANLGGAAIRSGDLEVAVEHLELSTRLAPEWGPGWVNLGVARYRMEKLDEAMAAFRRALEVEPDGSSAYANIAVVHTARGDEDAARAALEAAAKRGASPFSLIAMADLEIADGNFAAARSHLRRARWWYDDVPEVFEALARLARAEGNSSREQRYLKKAERLR